MRILGISADVAGILSFLLTVVLLFKSEALRKEIEMQKREYQKLQKKIRLNLMALRDNVWEDNILSLQIVSKIRYHFFSIQQNFKRLLTRQDKQHLEAGLKLLSEEPSTINPRMLCIELDYFIARLEKKELL